MCSKEFSEATKEEGLDWMVRYNGETAELQCPICFSANNQGGEE